MSKINDKTKQSGGSKKISISMPESTYERALAAADHDHRTFSSYVQQLIAEDLKNKTLETAGVS